MSTDFDYLISITVAEPTLGGPEARTARRRWRTFTGRVSIDPERATDDPAYGLEAIAAATAEAAATAAKATDG